jgi:hypothetical protein
MAFISNGTTVASGGSLQNVPAPTNSQILTGVASPLCGAVGGYLFARINSTKNPDNTFSGNNDDFKYGGKNNQNIPSGTYRIMGKTHTSDGDIERLTVVLRIS